MSRTENEQEKRRLLGLVQAGLYPTKIAVELGISLPAAMKRLRKLEAENLIKRQPGKPIFFSMVAFTSITKPNSMVSLSKGSDNHRIHSAHKLRLSIAYKGEQPYHDATYKRPFGRYRTAKQGIYKFKGYTIATFAKRLNIWVHYPPGQRTEQQVKEAKKMALLRLIGFAKDHNLKVQAPLSDILQSHHVIEDGRLNEALKPLFDRFEPYIREQIGSKVCQTSHKGRIEHEGTSRADRTVQGSAVAKGLEYLILDFPERFETDKLTRAEWNKDIRMYSKEIKNHLAAIHGINEGIREFNTTVKKLNSLIEKRL